MTTPNRILQNEITHSVITPVEVLSESKIPFYSLYIPINVDLDSLLEKNPIKIAHAKDYLTYLMHIIHSVPAFRKNVEIEDTDGYTILHSLYIKKVVDNYPPLMGWLEEQKIIEINHSFSERSSKGYRFAMNYRTQLKEQRIYTKTLIKNLTNNKRNKKHISKLSAENLYMVTPKEIQLKLLGYSKLATLRLSYLKQWLNDDLKVDVVGATNYLDKLLLKETEEKTKVFPIHNYNQRKMVLETLKGMKKRFFYVDDTSGRLHTLFTSLLSDLKAFITCKEEKIVSIDIKNSQPLLSLVFLNETLFDKNSMGERIGIFNGNFRGNNPLSLCSMFRNLIITHKNKADVLFYRIKVLDGSLYEYFGDLLQFNKIATNLKGGQLRSFAKKQIFRAFFDRNESIGKKDACALRLFKKHFPNVYEIFSLIKKGQHNTLACSLQNLEAEIILHKCCNELRISHPEMLLLTIHDSIATAENHITIVRETMIKYLYEALEATVILKEDRWDQSQLTRLKEENQGINPNIIKEVSGYGYADENDLNKRYAYSLSKVAKDINVGRNTFLKGLRSLQILQSDFPYRNIPHNQYCTNDYFKIVQSQLRHGRIQSTRVTDYGLIFIKQIVKENPLVFPHNKINSKDVRR